MLQESVIDMERVLCVEKYGSSSLKRSYSVNSKETADGDLTVKQHTGNSTSAAHFFRSVFLPCGYPESVSKDYLEYQIWDTIQAFSSSITGALATQAVLKGVGVGDDSATVLAATMTWILKDGTGMIGRILFAWMKGNYLDCDCKRWRLFADILNDFAICLEILAPYFQASFRLIVCVSGVAKSIVGVAGGATRAALTQHQARRNNMADVSAKDGSQETLVNLAALIFSLLLMPMVTGNQPLIWLLFVVFTSLHLFANYKAVKAVSMESFNQTRLHYVVASYLQSGCKTIPSVDYINKLEPVVWGLHRKLSVKLGVPLCHLTTGCQEVERLLQLYQQENYLLQLNIQKGVVCICLNSRATATDQLKASFHAEVLEFALSQKTSRVVQDIIDAVQKGDSWLSVQQSYQLVDEVFDTFLMAAHNTGWHLGYVLLCAEEWRADWNLSGLTDKKDF